MDGGRRRGQRQRRGTARALRVALLIATSVLLAAPAASAQDDPYGSTTTTAGAPPASVTCEADLATGQPGDEASATIRNLPPGGEVRLLFGGIDVGGTSTDRIDFTVPDLPPGTHLLTAVGVGFAVSCSAGLDGVEVLAGTITRRPEGSGALPRTGVFVALLVAVAVALLLLGRALVGVARDRRRREARAARAAVDARARDAERRGLVPK